MTIKDIAKRCGVSVSTVSRVLNNRPDVSEENRQKVLAVAKMENYVPNLSARDLVKTKSDCIGVVVRGVSNPFYTDVIRAMEEQITANGYTMVLQQISSGEDELRHGAIMEREKRLRGILFLGGRFDYTPEDLALLNVPFVCCSYSNRYGTLQPTEYSSVSIADEEEAYRAVRMLYDAGHRRIAALISCPEDQSISQLRYQGYRKALADCDLPFDTDLVIPTGSFHIQDAYKALKTRLEQGVSFTALFSIADNMAIGAMRALRETGRQLPEDCSIVAIDGLEVSEYIHPQLTTLCQPMVQMGQHSVQLLLDLIRGTGENRQVTLSTTLRPGASIHHL